VTKQELKDGTLHVNFEEHKKSEIASHVSDSNLLIADPQLLAEKWIEVSSINYKRFYREIIADDLTFSEVVKDFGLRIASKVKNAKLRVSPYKRSRKLLSLHVFSTESHATSIRDYLVHLDTKL
jgi:hypothetical protein